MYVCDTAEHAYAARHACLHVSICHKNLFNFIELFFVAAIRFPGVVELFDTYFGQFSVCEEILTLTRNRKSNSIQGKFQIQLFVEVWACVRVLFFFYLLTKRKLMEKAIPIFLHG